MYPPDLYPPAWSGPVYPPSTLYPLAGSRSVTGYIKPQKDGRASGVAAALAAKAPPRLPPTLGPLVLRRCGLERLLRGGRAAAARAFPAWEWMGDARGGAKRADPKGGALNHAWVPTENTWSNVSVSV